MSIHRSAKFGIGHVVRHREQPFRGVVVDVDACCEGAFATGISRDQPFYHVLAVGPEGGFLAYVPEESLAFESDVMPLSAADRNVWFSMDAHGRYAPRSQPIQ